MSFKFSKKSKEKLDTCHPDLRRLFNEVIKHYDCTIICGHRGKEEQDEAVRSGHSKVAWPNSKHNQLLSLAADVVPYPLKSWKDPKSFIHFAGFVWGVAKTLGIEIRCGIDFNRDLDFNNDNLFDGPHFELIQNGENKKP